MSNKAPLFEFHISRKARDDYRFDETLFSLRGDTLFESFRGAHRLAGRINGKRHLTGRPGPPLQASHLYAAGLLDEIIHYVIGRFKTEKCPLLFEKLQTALNNSFGDDTDKVLLEFARFFPSTPVYREAITPQEYLDGKSEGVPNRHIVIEELILLWLGNLNPAYSPLHELIDDSDLERETKYRDLMDSVTEFFKAMPPFGSGGQTLIDMLRAPAIHSPHSLEGQLKFIRERWGGLLGGLLTRLLKGIDFIHEEEKIRFDGPGESHVPDFRDAGYETEPERFSADLDWMPNVVLMAKCTYVWLDQLSKKFGRDIHKLDHIPDEELDRLAACGVTGLWLIGLWERSRASKKIKRWYGNPEAEASAYSLFDYDIAADLGGEAAYEDLKERAWLRGIRLASDMVPNHMGIDSRWVVEHPHWFVQSEHSPFPSYSFTGGDLSQDGRVELFIEDGYWHKSDAAVVFKRVDRETGEVRYLYHGNDGTQMPWNDTAQLNFLLEEVREAVIQTILHVARKFPIIRFDAAMTLAKKHYQRLWFPEPGSGGDIPSRAEYAMTKEEFNQVFPEEFWREVVDRVQRDVPDTLLLAEAFWMMEGYFVRTLGMHRVYNSAFMNMLKMEDNAKYREYIRKVLEFNPQILKRYVNFMNNPDEDTAIAQFGKNDKYFGVFVLMCTLPGLPMIGHGQIEGFSEKYGMEYRRAYWDEQPDEWLVDRHEREIFPLLKKRYLFSDVEHFLLYDFYTGAGHVDENVFAYSNRSGDEHALVVYHNKFADTLGWIKESAAYHDGKALVSRNISDGLGLSGDGGAYALFRDHMAGLEYIRSSSDIAQNGLFVSLGAFKCHVFLDFREVLHSSEEPYCDLAAALDGAGVPSIGEALAEFVLRPVMEPFSEALNAGSLKYLAGGCAKGKIDPDVLKTFREKLGYVSDGIAYHEESKGLTTVQMDRAILAFETLLKLPCMGKGAWGKRVKGLLPVTVDDSLSGWRVAIIWLFLSHALAGEKGGRAVRTVLFDEWRLNKIVRESFEGLGAEPGRIEAELALIKVLLLFVREESEITPEEVGRWLGSEDAKTFLGVNRHEGILWFNKEGFEELITWLFIATLLNEPERGKLPPVSLITKRYAVVDDLLDLAEESGCQLELLMKNLTPEKTKKSIS